MSTPTDIDLDAIPDWYKAASFAVHTIGPVHAGILPEHVIAAGSFLGSCGMTGTTLVANIGKAYEAMLAEVGPQPTEVVH